MTKELVARKKCKNMAEAVAWANEQKNAKGDSYEYTFKKDGVAVEHYRNPSKKK